MHVVYEDNHLLAIDKQAGIPSQPDASGDPSLIDIAKAWVKEKYAKPGDVYLGLLHRLDRPVSGLVLTARTSKAATRMSDLFRRREIDKKYLALVECNEPCPESARLEDRLEKSENGGVVRSRGKGGLEARLSFQRLALDKESHRALVLVQLETGVKHQIRAQLALRGFPVVGDFRYGPFGKPARPEPVEEGSAILLHAAYLAFEHPVGKGKMELKCPPPKYWRQFVENLEPRDKAAAWL